MSHLRCIFEFTNKKKNKDSEDDFNYDCIICQC